MSLLPPMLRRSSNPDKGFAGRKAEKSLATRIAAQLQPGSGALHGVKGDMTKADFLLENKSSQSASFSVKQEQLQKVYQEALALGRKPALAFQFVNSGGNSQKQDRWVCVPESVFEELLRGD